MDKPTFATGYNYNHTRYQIHNAQDRPDLWDSLKDTRHQLNTAWPVFLDQDATFQLYYPMLVEQEELARYQFVITEAPFEKHASVVACARSVPFFWPEMCQQDAPHKINPGVLETLPDGGYDTILSRAVRQCFARHGLSGPSVVFTRDQELDTRLCNVRNPPNALSAISITVQPDHRQQGLAEALIQMMKSTAIDEGLDVLVVPLRPTRKGDFPLVPMSDYITWPREEAPTLSFCAEHNSSKAVSNDPQLHSNSFDPWLRKHLQLGGKIAKIAPQSMVVDGSVSDWTRWTGRDFRQLMTTFNGQKQGSQQECCVDVTFAGGLIPLRLYIPEGRGVYVEPNIWLYHELQNG